MADKVMVLCIETGETTAMWPIDAAEAVAMKDYVLAPLQPGVQALVEPPAPPRVRQPGAAA